MKKTPSVKLELINKTSLCIKVTIPGSTKRFYKKLDVSIDPKFWDAKNEIIKKGYPNVGAVNTEIWKKKNKLEDIFKRDGEKKVVFTPLYIKKKLTFEDIDPAQDFYAFAKEQVGLANYSSETRRTYYGELTKMEKHTPLLSFADIDYSWIQKYEQYLRDKLENHPNTIWKSLKFINTMLNTAIKVGGLIDKNPFKDYKRGQYKQGIPTYVDWKEAQLIHAEVTGDKLSDTLKLTGYYALLSYYTGLRFSDAVKFDYNKKVIDDATGRRLVLYAQKNNEIVSIKFNKYVAEVVDYLRDKPIRTTNQDFNANIKRVCASAKVYKEDISAHSFRHGFAMRCAELGAGIDEVQRLLGHNKRSSTEIYFRIRDKRTDDVMDKWE